MLNGTLKDNEYCHNCGEQVRILQPECEEPQF